MSNIRVNGRLLSMWLAVMVVLAICAAPPVSASEARESSIGMSGQAPATGQLSAPGNPRWDGETGTATWGSVPGAGKPNQWGGISYYEWRLYRLDTDRTISSADDLQDYESVRYSNVVHNDSVVRVNLSEWMSRDGYYYYTVFAYGDGTTHTNSPRAVSDAFHYVKPEAKLPVPTGLQWQWLESDKKYFSVWDNIFGEEFINAEGFNIEGHDESGEIYTQLFTRAELIEARDERGRPGPPLYLNNPDGRYRFKVQAVSANANQCQSSDWSDFSPWVEVRPARPPQTSESSSSTGDGNDDDDDDDDDNDSGSGSESFDSGRYGGGFSSAARPARPVVQTSGQISALAAQAESKGETVARSRGTGEVTIKGSAWTRLEGLGFQHDTVANGAVQVRVTINNPTALTQDVRVSGYVTGKDAELINSIFDKYFSNKTRAIHFDQAGQWGQDVRVAARIDLAGMDKDRLVFYVYDRAANAYRQIQDPRYSVDDSGYVYFSTPYAGDIVVCDGTLSRKQ